MLAAGSLAAGDLVVDFGCGSGNLTLPLAARFPVLEVVGVDVKREAVDLLRSRAWIFNSPSDFTSAARPATASCAWPWSGSAPGPSRLVASGR
mmetsp:Transcript_82543/g.267388  ORF Transcript_82543/g.267388 Transcript_82543/m.267388 type:complete len:93 (-) Transcript_82543:1044-1322(-)